VASLIAIGDVIMEPMMPARMENLRNPSVKKFHDRFGQHFHSIAWYVDDVRPFLRNSIKSACASTTSSALKSNRRIRWLRFWTHPKENVRPVGIRFARRLYERSAV